MQTTETRPFARAMEALGPPRPLLGVTAGLAMLGVLIAVDLLLDRETAALVGPFVLAPFVTALLAGPLGTGAVGGVAAAAALASTLWNDMDSLGDYWVRFGVVVVGTIFAIVFAANRMRSAGRARELRLLDAVGEVADGSLPLDETLRRVTEVIVPAVGDFCMIDAVHDGKATRVATRVEGTDDAPELERRIARRRPSPPPWLVEVERAWRRTPLWRPRVTDEDLRRMAHDAEDLAFLRSLGLCSYVIVPIVARERNLGVLTLASAWSGRHYDADDVRFAQTLSGRVALALDNAGLFSDLESFERRMDTVMAIIDEAVVMHGPGGELLYANPAAARTLGFDSVDEALAARPDALSARLIVRDEAGNDVGADALRGLVSLSGVVPRPRTLRVTERATGEERWLRTRSRPIEAPDQRVLYSVTVIEDVSDVMRAEFAQRLLARTGELVSHAHDHRRTMEEVASLLVPDFADCCTVSTPGADRVLELRAVCHRDPARRRHVFELRERHPVNLDGEGGSAQVVRTGEPILLREITAEDDVRQAAGDDEYLRRLKAQGFGSAIIAPMLVGGQVIGTVGFLNERSSRLFDGEDLALAGEVARRAGFAIENARLAAERARVADVLQRELLPPSLPEVPGWEIETMYQPAGEVNDVGGDFYEVFRVGSDWAIVLGDVSGRGAAAASLTAEARHTIRTAGALSSDPTAGLRLLDANLRGRDDAALCSAVLLLVPDAADDRDEVVVYLAGHPFPLLLRGDETLEVGTPGPALGVVDAPAWDPSPIAVATGEQIVLYTDGVIEARRSGGERFGVERLRATLSGCARPEAAVARVRDGLEDFLSHEPEDDAALVVMRRTRLAAPAPGVGASSAALAG